MDFSDVELDMIQTDTVFMFIIAIAFIAGLYFIANTFQKAKNSRLIQKEAELSGSPSSQQSSKSRRKMMIRDIVLGGFLISLAILLLPINSTNAAEGQAMCDAYMRKYAKFPESLKIHFLSYTMEGDTIEWSVHYSAKNAFGMRLRETAFLKTYNRTLEDQDGYTYTFDELGTYIPMVDRFKIGLSSMSDLRSK